MQISNEVLGVLSSLEISGNTITMPKLERGLYLKVDQVLQAMGGKWNKKMKAHIFSGEPAPLVEQVLALGEVTTHKDLGFFRTPPALAHRLVQMADVRPGHVVLEPSAGDGAIVEALVAVEASVVCVERDKGRRMGLFSRVALDWLTVTISLPPLDVADDDFMEYRPIEPFDRVVMNPPFLKVGLGDHLDHVRHAFGMLVPGGVLVSVLPAGVMFRQDRRHREFLEWTLAGSSIQALPDGSFKASGTSVRTVVLRLVKP